MTEDVPSSEAWDIQLKDRGGSIVFSHTNVSDMDVFELFQNSLASRQIRSHSVRTYEDRPLCMDITWTNMPDMVLVLESSSSQVCPFYQHVLSISV